MSKVASSAEGDSGTATTAGLAASATLVVPAVAAVLGTVSAVFCGVPTVFTLVALPVWYTTVEDVGSVLARFLPQIRSKRAPVPRGGILVSKEG